MCACTCTDPECTLVFITDVSFVIVGLFDVNSKGEKRIILRENNQN